MIEVIIDEDGWYLDDGYQAVFPDGEDEATDARELAAALIAAAERFEQAIKEQNA